MSPASSRRGSTPGRHVYDVAVVGGEVAGALAAALLARHGLQVLYIENDDTGDGYEHEGWLFPLGPFVMPAPKLVPVLEEFLTELGINTEFARATRPPAPALQLLTHDARLELPSNPEARAVELARALGSEAEASALGRSLEALEAASSLADGFFQARPELIPSGTIARWKLRRRLLEAPELSAAAALPAPVPGTSEAPLARLLRALVSLCASVATPGPLTQNRPLGKTLAAPLRVPGGRSGLRELLATRAQELGADVVSAPDSGASIAFEGSKPVGLRLRRGDAVYRAGAIVAAVDRRGLARLLPEEQRKPLASLPPLEAPRTLFTASVVVPEQAIPVGLGELALVDAAPGALGPLFVQTGPARKAGPGDVSLAHRTLTLGAVVAREACVGAEAELRALVDALWAAVDELLPFTRGQAVTQSTPWLHAPGVAERAWEPHPLYELPADAVAGVTGLPTEWALGRVFLAGRAVLPGLGIEGEALSAFLAAEHVQRVLNKGTRSPHRR